MAPEQAPETARTFIEPISVDNLSALLRERVRRTPKTPAYRWFDRDTSRWRDIDWRGVAARVARWQAAMLGEGVRAGDRVALMAGNGLDWVCFDQAAMGLGLVVVPLYFNDRGENVGWILRRTGARLLFVDDPAQWLRVSPQLRDVSLRIVLGEGDGLDFEADERLALLRDWLPADGGELRTSSASRSALATIVYTSGTAGRPKGVLLTHGSILWNAWASHRCSEVHADDVFLSFLPLSHMLERTVGCYLPTMAGATVAFARSVANLAEDLVQIRPTVLISVPRIYERIHARIDEGMKQRSPLGRRLFHAAVATGWARFEHAQGRGHWSPRLLAWPLLRRLVANRVTERLGGRLRIAVCGGAPLQMHVARRFIALGVPLVQGYGMTELGPVVSGNSLEDNDPASVGRPLRDVELRIGPANELLVRSPGLMQGYLDDDEATAAAIDADGWMHTGDCGRIEDGRIYITGRIKDIIVLSNGEKVSPVDMESAIAMHPLFEQAMVVGEGRPFLAALLVLDPTQWEAFVAARGLRGDANELLTDPRAHDEVCRQVGDLLASFPGYAQVRRVALTLEPWTVDNGLLTPTMKLRRTEVMERMSAALAHMYAGH
ncbi:MAG: AMP-dependent synthetase/ligase [Gammaproteobacteria bacterium]|nr:AMP-dependent synthetase/ligase [Gammaproteobacteria bacterium]